MSQFKNQSVYIKSALCTLTLGFVTHLVSLASPYWLLTGSGAHLGLWLNCVDTSCQSMAASPVSEWIRSCQVLDVMSIVTSLASLTVMLVTAFTHNYKQQQRKARHIFIIVLSFISAVFLQIAIAVAFRANFPFGVASLSWSVPVGIIAVVFYGITGIVMIIDLLRLIFYGDTQRTHVKQSGNIG
ncbi:lens fiber membrane intrinsic protein-like [Argopecten irradians]|uniref:lens fiber membrane intrinsic protein-like n=1 Tax=Argopecten irradians TaxID=31199 RepID=UPI0037198A11